MHTPHFDPGDLLKLKCPGCIWRSDGSVVHPVTNGVWFAFKEEATAYRKHRRESHSDPDPIIVREYNGS